MDDQNELRCQLINAARFFQNDYQDRGMVKWQGYFLSDHTEDVGKYSKNRTNNRKRQDHEEMSEETISQYLMKAFDQHFTVTIQLRNHDTEGIVSPLYHGKVLGFHENSVVLSDNTQVFLLSDILYVE
ncbi:hypothetical protein [Weissella bombi]|uniref:YolD-like protein n=1 Tax=Weissella bombi TaxID=1505725 RepID=A0A1C3YZ52_9LACO|nr:hypothetical protein [Weissella bombi]SCB75427.1 hypothetical protein GA0061074_101219 [Weissella bombi]